MKSDRKEKNILVLNCGSSSLKYKLIRMPGEKILIRGEAQRLGIKTEGVSVITHFSGGNVKKVENPLSGHGEALCEVLGLIEQEDGMKFDAFAHRYVHPGDYFTRTVKIDESALDDLKKTLPLAAIHNPVSYNLIDFCHRRYSSVPQFAVFDTAFHKTIPPEYYTYALPRKIAGKYGLRKVGFHGISHRYSMEEACRFLRKNKSSQKIIVCHLGTGGSSVCAIKEGKSINNSMGFTPLEGLIMNTRCGDMDAGTVFYLMSRENFSPEEAENILNKKSGILGLFSRSSDLRDVIRLMGTDNKAKTAFDMYVNRVRTYVVFYSMILRKADILVFTDSLGVEEPVVRRAICEKMEFTGIVLDKKKNSAYSRGIEDISSPDSETRILVIPSDEEIMIAREVHKEMKKNGSGS